MSWSTHYCSVAAVEACRWADKAVPQAPYVTSIPWIDHYGCQFVVHGDDISTDGNGEDCYRFVRAADRFLIVKRTPGISTTDLVGRMLLITKTHFLQSIQTILSGEQGPGNEEERKQTADAAQRRIIDYATDRQGKEKHVDVLSWCVADSGKEGGQAGAASQYQIKKLVPGKEPLPGQRIVYVDGAFDLFSTGHIEFLKRVVEAEEQLARSSGWYESVAVEQIQQQAGELLAPAFLVIGVHDDEVVNNIKGSNYPIMNVFERGLCVLQCKVSVGILMRSPVCECLLTQSVRQLSRLWRALHSHHSLPGCTPLRTPPRCLPRPNILYEHRHRPLCRCKGTGHLP